MKRFLFKSILFFLIIAVVIFSIIGYYYFTFKTINTKPSNESIFIWGDSQAKAAFNLETLNELTNKDVYSAAVGGAGVFDFLAFTEVVPDSSITIIAISPLSLLRDRDKNQTGIPIVSLPFLMYHNFPNLLYSIRINIRPKQIFYTNNHLYPYRDTLTYHEPLSKFQGIYAQKNNSFETKELAFIYGIDRLLEKKCGVIFVQFPIHYYLYDIIPSKAKEDYSAFLLNIMNKLEPITSDTLFFNNQYRNMYDLTHLNEKGANDFSTQLGNYINKSKTNNGFIIVNGGISK